VSACSEKQLRWLPTASYELAGKLKPSYTAHCSVEWFEPLKGTRRYLFEAFQKALLYRRALSPRARLVMRGLRTSHNHKAKKKTPHRGVHAGRGA
jgi:hypothetical protein